MAEGEGTEGQAGGSQVVEGGGGAEGAAQEHWTSQWSDKELGAAIQTKGYDGPEALGKAYVSLSKHLGADADSLVRLPREDDHEGWTDVWKRLGRPDDPSGYELPEGDLGDWFRGVASELNMPARMAKELAERFGGKLGELTAQADQGTGEDVEAVHQRLQAEWGDEYKANMASADRAIAKLGLQDEQLIQMRDSKDVGSEIALKLLVALGNASREDGYPGTHGQGEVFGDTPQVKVQRFKDLQDDARFMERVNSGDAQALREFRRASELAYGNEPLPGGPR